jgi:hypothetical protein
MALARIITRSHMCSRQLAFDLIARGYAVEIVSPDSIPDNLADLELRVEEDPGNQLVASVEAHNGARTAALEFLHYLKAPMPDFIRRPPESDEAALLPKQPVSINAGHGTGEVELPAAAPQPVPKAVSQAATVLRDLKLDAELDPEEGARLILPRDPLTSLPSDPPNSVALRPSLTLSMIAEPTSRAAAADPVVANPVVARPITARPVTARPVTNHPITPAPMTDLRGDDQSSLWPQSFDHFTEQFPGVALTLASMVVLIIALIFGFGMHRSGKTAVQSSVAAQDASIPGASIDPEEVLALPWSQPASSAEGHPANAPKESPVSKIDRRSGEAPTEAPTTVQVSHGRRGGLIARDTVTYFDHRVFAAASRGRTSQNSAHRRPISRKQDGVIAANTVTDLNNNPAPKAAKPDSGIKRYSDLK